MGKFFKKNSLLNQMDEVYSETFFKKFEKSV